VVLNVPRFASSGLATAVAGVAYRYHRLKGRGCYGCLRFVEEELQLLRVSINVNNNHVTESHLTGRRKAGEWVDQKPLDGPLQVTRTVAKLGSPSLGRNRVTVKVRSVFGSAMHM